jgi:Putative zinc-finger
VTGATDLTCRELVELVSDYLENTLSSEDRARFEMHLVYCRGCHIYVEHMRKTLRLMGVLSEDSLDDGARESLLEAFRDWKREGGR